jgi:predicted metal-dependent phosphotriesterase family hydrolase
LHARDGGPGYARAFILAVPLMMKSGIPVDAIRRITIDNPRRFLTFVPRSV